LKIAEKLEEVQPKPPKLPCKSPSLVTKKQTYITSHKYITLKNTHDQDRPPGMNTSMICTSAALIYEPKVKFGLQTLWINFSG
jgi:hypothetical protein